MQKEIFARGPIACTIDAAPIEKYQGGIATGFSLMTDHVRRRAASGHDLPQIGPKPRFPSPACTPAPCPRRRRPRSRSASLEPRLLRR